MFFRGILLLTLLLGQILSSAAEEVEFGPFWAETSEKTILLNGEIDARSALSFRRVIDAVPDAEVLILNSPGGLVQIGLLIADDVHRMGLATYIPAQAGCYSSCSLIFLAGKSRLVEGELGVHQLSNASSDLESAQTAISDIIDVLDRFDTPTQVLTAMFRTPPDEMYVFTQEEIAEYGLSRSDLSEEIALPLPEEREEVAPPADETRPASDTQEDADGSQAVAKLSALQDLADQPARVAVYAGLDFYGRDIASFRADDAADCAARCLASTQTCNAFTFNMDETLVRGPNCFIKESRGQLDGNAVALSGLVLSRTDRVPDTFEVGVIDPNEGVFEDVDLPGGDLAQRPEPNVATGPACRLACVRNSGCRAFTFIEQSSQCWLKHSLGEPRYATGMTSGLKIDSSFEPISVLTLD